MNSSPHNSTPTQLDVARALGIDQSTVSLALRNSPRIPLQRRQEIQAAAANMGYRSNPMATALAHLKKTSKEHPVQAALAWLNAWRDPSDLRKLREFNLYWLGASACAEKFGYRLEEFKCDATLSGGRLERVLLARGINGLLLPPHPYIPDWGNFRWEQFSIVRFGRSLSQPVSHLVTSDQVANMILCVSEVMNRGYKRVGFFGNPKHAPWHLFEAGYLKAQQQLPARQRLASLHLLDTAKDTQRALEQWIKKQKPDAIITANPGLPDMLEKAGVRYPDDIGVAATSTLDANVDAGIYQNSEEIGRVAVLLLISLIHDNDVGVPARFREVLIKGDFVDGKSLPKR